MKVCNICGEKFENGRVYSNHVRWKHKLNKKKCKFCNKEFSCGLEQHENACMLNPKNYKYCKECSKQILEYDKEFCNSSCSVRFNNKRRVYNKGKKKIVKCEICKTDIEIGFNATKYGHLCKKCKTIENIKKYKNNKKIRSKRIYPCTCVVCGNEFEHFSNPIKTCSKECCSELLSRQSKANPNCGGETNYKKYYYKGIYMDSTWELEIAQWMDKNGIEWKRSRKIMFWWTDKEGNRRRYYPDFYLPKYDLYLDPKNKYLLKKDKYKLTQVIKENKISLVYGDRDYIIRAVSDKS